jgi:hypothetical protein
MPVSKITGAAVAACLIAMPLAAEEQNLKFRFVTFDLGSADFESANFDADAKTGNTLLIGKSAGVAIFEDGRIAVKRYVFFGDIGQAGIAGKGYSTYEFEGGNALNFSFTFENGGGDYTLVSGTGAYEGATGTGRFDGIDSPWEGADAYNGWFKLEMPGS